MSIDRPSDQPALPAPRSRPVPKKVKAACEAIVSGKVKTITDAAEHAGISREYLSRELGKPAAQEFLRQKAARNVAIASGRASARIGELIDASSEHVAFDAARHVLAVAGIKPVAEPNVNLNIEMRAGYVIDIRGRGEGEGRTITLPASRVGE
jgi:hypothetical protein